MLLLPFGKGLRSLARGDSVSPLTHGMGHAESTGVIRGILLYPAPGGMAGSRRLKENPPATTLPALV